MNYPTLVVWSVAILLSGGALERRFEFMTKAERFFRRNPATAKISAFAVIAASAMTIMLVFPKGQFGSQVGSQALAMPAPQTPADEVVPSLARGRVTEVIIAKAGQGCMELTGLTITECVQAAHSAGRKVYWHRTASGKTTIFAPMVQEGEVWYRYEEAGESTILMPKD